MKKDTQEGYFQRLHYWYLNGPSDVGIMLLHPISLNAKWISQIAYLFNQRGFKVWSLDLPGHGESNGRKKVPLLAEISVIGKLFQAVDFDLEEATDEILAFAKTTKGQVKHLVGGGFSFGGVLLGFSLGKDKENIFDAAFVQCFADSPEDVRAYENNKFMIGLTSFVANVLGTAPAPFFVKMSTPLIHYFLHPKDGLKELDWVINKWSLDNESILLATKRTLVSLHYSKKEEDPEIPILLLWPQDDAISGWYPNTLARRLPKGEFLFIPGAIHSVFVNGSQDEFKPKIVEDIAIWVQGALERK